MTPHRAVDNLFPGRTGILEQAKRFRQAIPGFEDSWSVQHLPPSGIDILHQVLEAGLPAASNKRLDFLRTGTSCHHERVGHIDNDKVVYTETCDKATRSGYDNPTRRLLGDNYKGG
jgi:hypothetical protein